MLLSVAIRQRIINLSKQKNLSIRKLSKKSDIPYTTLVNFMSGKGKTINVSTLYNICMGLEISLVDFFDSPIFLDALDEHEKSTSKNET